MPGAPAIEQYTVEVIGEGIGKVDFLPCSLRTGKFDDWLYDPIRLKCNSKLE